MAQAPQITSFSPTTGAVGTSVTINGSGFGTTPAANAVYFGAVRAVVTSATATSVTVTAPSGATCQPITLTAANLTATANGFFIVTFPSNPSGITANSFAPKTDFVTGTDPERIVVVDLDDDGKSDMITANQNSLNISVFRNTSSSGSISFATKVDIAIGGDPFHVAVGDIDGDGKPDLAVANNSGGRVAVFKNTSTTGAISFAAKVEFTTRSNARCTAIGDLDGDGKPELVVANSSGIALSVLTNTTSGGTISFAAAIDVFGSGFQNVTIADMDGDGKPDLVGGDNYNSVAVLRNTTTSGSISFAARVPFTTPMSTASVSVADFDGDGKADIAAAVTGGVVSLFRNTSATGTISFATRADFAAGNNARGISVGDVDGDGKPDLAVTNSGAATVSVLKNTSSLGAIAFTGKVDYATGQFPYSVAIADMDGDGKPDLSVANHNYTSSSISVIRNQTDGPSISSFTPTNAAAGSSVAISGLFLTGTTAVTIGRVAATSFTVDSDGQITAVVPGVVGGSIVVSGPNGSASLAGFYNGPTVSSVAPVSGPLGTAVIIGGTNFNPVAAANAVYVGAVKATVSAATATSLTATIPAGTTYQPVNVTTGNRTAYSAQAFATTFTSNATGLTANSFVSNGNGTSSEAIGDLDGDGKPDYVTFNPNINAVNVYRNISTIGLTSFTLTNLSSGTNVNSVALGDLDGDGKLEVVLTYYNSDIVAVFKNTSTSGSLSFTARQDIATGSSRTVASIHDIDGDGKPDLALASDGSSIVSLLRNTTTGGTISFAAKTDVSVNSVTRVTLGDLNADGKPEMVVANYYAGTVSVLRNTSVPGAMSFAPQVNYTTGSVPTAAIIADFNGDGKPDLAVTNQSASTVSVLKNESSGGTISFAAATSFATGVGPMALSAADVDGDGKPGLIVANGTAYSVSVLKNTSSGGAISFAAKLDLTTGANIIHTSTADYDGDGRQDIAVTGSILLNKTAGTDIFSATPLNAAVGTSVVINGINFTGATAVSFGGVAASSFTVNSDGQITATVANIAGGKVVVTTSKGTATLNGFYNGPAITSFSPASGPIGTTVTISGTNFNTTAAANTVYFGAVKAVVSAATSTSFTVTVPTGATYQPVSVTAGAYTSYSTKPFAVTFSSPAGNFTAGSFAPKVDFAAGSNPSCVATGDLDGDGKTDMIVGNTGSNIISVYKNTGSPGTIAFGTKLDMGNGYYPNNIAVGDINGDGKLDLAVVIYNSRSIAVYRNTSSGGTISFASEVSFYVGNGSEPRQVVISDLDGDGKPDMAVANSYGQMGIYKNMSTGSTISFAAKQEMAPALTTAYSIAAADFDGDGKPELALTYYNSSLLLSIVGVFKNLSQSGTILFDTEKNFVIGYNNRSTAVGDLDGDGKADLVVTNIATNDVAVLRNTTTSGTISFANAISVLTGTAPYSVAISDFDGDEKPDLVVANSGAASVSVLKNNSTPGSFSFAPKQDYATGTTPYNVIVADFDGNGKPDIATANSGANSFSVLRNLLAPAEPCVGGSISYTSNLSGANYQWQVNTGSGFVNISDNTNYSGTSTATLQLINLASAWYGYQYRCVVDGLNSNVFTLEFKNYWTGAVSNAWENAGNWSCGMVPDANTDVAITTGAPVVTSMAVCRSLKLATSVTVKVTTGYSLLVTK